MWPLVASRWILPREDRRPLQREIPRGPQAGLGTLFNSVALLGPAVSAGTHTFSVAFFFSADLLSVCRKKRFVALKVVKSAPHYTETAVDEIKLLRCVSVVTSSSAALLALQPHL